MTNEAVIEVEVTDRDEQDLPIKADGFTYATALLKGFLGFVATAYWFASLVDDLASVIGTALGYQWHTVGGLLGYSWPAAIIGIIISAPLLYCETYCYMVQNMQGQVLTTALKKADSNNNQALSIKSKRLLMGSFLTGVFWVAGLLTSTLLDVYATLIGTAIPSSGKIMLLMFTLIAGYIASNAKYRTHKAVLEIEENIVSPSNGSKESKPAVADGHTNVAALIKGPLICIATYIWITDVIDNLIPMPIAILGHSWVAAAVGSFLSILLIGCAVECHRRQDTLSQHPQNSASAPPPDQTLPSSSKFLLFGLLLADGVGFAGLFTSVISKLVKQVMPEMGKIIFLIGPFFLGLLAAVSGYRAFKKSLLQKEYVDSVTSPKTEDNNQSFAPVATSWAASFCCFRNSAVKIISSESDQEISIPPEPAPNPVVEMRNLETDQNTDANHPPSQPVLALAS